MLLCAFLSFLAHSMIPHHHDTDHESVAHQHDHNSDDSDDSHSPLKHPFSYHAAEFGKVAVKSNDFTIDQAKVFPSFDFDLPPSIAFSVATESPPDISYPGFYKSDRPLAIHYSCNSLRAPPYRLV